MGLKIGGIYEVSGYDARVAVVKSRRARNVLAAIVLRGTKFEDETDILIPKGIVYPQDYGIKITQFCIVVYPRVTGWLNFNWEKAYVGMLDKKFHEIMRCICYSGDPFDEMYDTEKHNHIGDIVGMFYNEELC